MKILNKIIESLSFDDVFKNQKKGDPKYPWTFSNEDDTFDLETIHIEKLRELNMVENDDVENGYYPMTLTELEELGEDEEYEVSLNLLEKLIDGVELSPIVVDSNYEILDGRHRLQAYSELYFYHKEDYPIDPNLKIYKKK